MKMAHWFTLHQTVYCYDLTFLGTMDMEFLVLFKRQRKVMHQLFPTGERGRIMIDRNKMINLMTQAEAFEQGDSENFAMCTVTFSQMSLFSWAVQKERCLIAARKRRSSRSYSTTSHSCHGDLYVGRHVARLWEYGYHIVATTRVFETAFRCPQWPHKSRPSVHGAVRPPAPSE